MFGKQKRDNYIIVLCLPIGFTFAGHHTHRSPVIVVVVTIFLQVVTAEPNLTTILKNITLVSFVDTVSDKSVTYSRENIFPI